LLLISGANTGRLLKYDPTKSNEVEVLVDGLSFANGLAMSTDGTARHVPAPRGNHDRQDPKVLDQDTESFRPWRKSRRYLGSLTTSG
jgi:hypothetical protein